MIKRGERDSEAYVDEPLQLEQEVGVLGAVLQVEVEHRQPRDRLHGFEPSISDLMAKYLRRNF